MQVIIKYEGDTYESMEDDSTTAEEAHNRLFENIEEGVKVKIKLKTGEYLVVGKEVVQRAVFIIKD